MGIDRALWRAVAVFRTLGLLYACAVYLRRYDEYAHPLAGWLVLALMALWTATTVVVYNRPALRTWPLLGLDLALAMGAVVAGRWLDAPERIAAGAQTLPVVWAAAPLLAFAVRGGWPAGLLAACGIGAADMVHRGQLTVATGNNIVLLVLAGTVVGHTVALARRGEAALARANEVEAATRERERMSRDIHDSVLQVLALVGRRGREAGGEAAEIGRLAAEQELALRALVGAVPEQPHGEVDVRALLSAYASGTVTVSAPATPVVVTAERGKELVAAVGAALANVAAHAGAGAHAWVLLEDDGTDLLVSIRDDGVGMTADRLSAARSEGRLGVVSSIEGRVRDLGGSATLVSSPGVGTEVELRVPVRVAGGSR